MSYVIKRRVKDTIYLYKVTSYWDKEKKQPRQKSVYIGKQDVKTQKIIEVQHQYNVKEYGNIYFLKEIDKRLCVSKLLAKHFDSVAKEVIYLAYYKLCEYRPLYLCKSWLETIDQEEEMDLSSQSISNLLKILSERKEWIFSFLKEWIDKIQPKNKYIFFDISSLSTYSRAIDFSEWGYNRDKESLEQINLGVIFGEPTGLPLYYSLYPGSITDVTTLKSIVEQLDELSLSNTIFILDKGFFSSTNLAAMKKIEHIIPFIIRNKKAKELIKKYCLSINSVENIIRLRKKIYYCIKEGVKIETNNYSAYIYLDEAKRVEQKETFINQIVEIEDYFNTASFSSEEQIEKIFSESKKEYRKYFYIETRNEKFIIVRRNEKIKEKIDTFGMFILLCNALQLTGGEVLELYRKRDSIEKYFDSIKNEIKQKRLHIHSQEALEGLLFIDFIALIFYSYIIKIMREKELTKEYTVPEIMFELKKIRKINISEKKTIITEVSKMQADIFQAFDISIPMYYKKGAI
jgi:transposase